MDGLVFVGALLCLALVLGWYLGCEACGRGGDTGVLGLRLNETERAPAGPAYRVKARAARPLSRAGLSSGTDDSVRRYRQKGPAAAPQGAAYRLKNGARYRVKARRRDAGRNAPAQV